MTTRYAHLSPDHKTEAVRVLETFKGSGMDTFWTLREVVKQDGIRNSL